MLETLTPELLTRAQNGDHAVVGDLYGRYHVNIFRYLYYRLGDVHAAEDLTSEVFVRMMRSLPGYQIKNVPFEAWLFQIARNLAIDHYRKYNQREQLSLEDDMLADRIDEPDRSLERNLTSDLLLKALAKLGDVQRDVIVLRFVNGLPIAQVAQTLHRSENAIKAMQRRALAALRETLVEWEINYA